MDTEEDDFEEEGVEVVDAEEEEMDILDDDWLIPDVCFFLTILDSALLFNHYRTILVYREVILTFDLTLAPDRDHKIKKYHQKWNLHTQIPYQRSIAYHSITSCSKPKISRQHLVAIFNFSQLQNFPEVVIRTTKLNLFYDPI